MTFLSARRNLILIAKPRLILFFLLPGLILSILLGAQKSAFALTINQATKEEAKQVSVFVPNSYIEKHLEEHFSKSDKVFEKNFDKNNINVNADELSFVIPKIAFNIKGPMQLQNNQLQSNFSATAVVSPISIHQIISKSIAGIPVNVHVDLDCDSFVISNNNIEMSSTWSFASPNRRLHAVLDNLKMLVGQSPWTISPIQCTGTNGADSILTDKIKSQLLALDVYKHAIETELQTAVNDMLSNSLDELRKPQNIEQLNLNNLRLISETSLPNQGFLFQYQAELEANQSPSQQDLNQIDNNKQAIVDYIANKSIASPLVIVNENNLIEYLRDFISKKTVQKDLQSFDSFHSLMKSRFKQFFAWPDLMNYDKNASFPTTSQISKLKTFDISQWQGNSGLGNLDCEVKSVVLGERKGNSVRYLNASSQYKGQFKFQINQGNINIESRLNSLNNTITMDADYVHKFHAKTRMPISLINSGLASNLNQLVLSYPLPSLHGPKQTTYLAKTVEASNGLVFINLEDQKN